MLTQLPLTQSIFEGHRDHLYPFLSSIVIQTAEEKIQIDEYAVSCHWFLDAGKFNYARCWSELSQRSFDRYAAKNDVHCQNEFIALMPRKVWLDFTDFLKAEESKRSWNSWTKLFCYIYFNCAKHIGCAFSHSREQFQKALGMQGADISYKIKVLEQKGFLSRTNYNADQGIARSYVLAEKYWPQYRQYQAQKLVDNL